jgi:FkbM family methyltransferase
MKIINKIITKIKHEINLIRKIKSPGEIQQERVLPWLAVKGDKTLRLNYPLNNNSIVVDVGGYEGQWASDIFSKYCCNIIIFEPVKKFSDKIKERFVYNKKIICHNLGLSNKDQEVEISLLDDSSSLFKNDIQNEKVKLVNTADFFKKNNIIDIDLIKINIEGGEYDLLKNLIENKIITKIKNIQVQFHDFVPNAKERMHDIQLELGKTHHLTYKYEFVWENWEKNK